MATKRKSFSNIGRHAMHTILSVPSNLSYHTFLTCQESFFFHHEMETARSSETSIHI